MTPQQHLSFCRDLHKSYASELNIAQSYLHGNPVLPLAPVVANPGGVMVIGAYPTAKFASIGGQRDVPVADIDAPFSNQTYFDGSQVRDVRAGSELQEYYLKPLGLSEKQLWLTNLVKVFLFKQGHVDKYKELGHTISESRTRFNDLARAGLENWIPREVALCDPKAVILLGEEVSSITTGVSGSKRVQRLFNGQPHIVSIGKHQVPAFCLPHPGIVMRQHNAKLKDGQTNWSARLQALLPDIRKWLKANLK